MIMTSGSDPLPLFLNVSGARDMPDPDRMKPAKDWPPVTITREMMDAQIEMLADLPRPANGRRQVMLVHPNAPDPGRGLTPGVRVTLDVLKPGEETVPVRHNSTQVSFCIRG